MLYKDNILNAIEKSNNTNDIIKILENDIWGDADYILDEYNKTLKNNNPNNYENLKANKNEIAKIAIFWNNLPLEFKVIIRMLENTSL